MVISLGKQSGNLIKRLGAEAKELLLSRGGSSPAAHILGSWVVLCTLSSHFQCQSNGMLGINCTHSNFINEMFCLTFLHLWVFFPFVFIKRRLNVHVLSFQPEKIQLGKYWKKLFKKNWCNRKKADFRIPCSSC